LPRRFSENRACAIVGSMTEDQVKKILDRVLTWPPERQADLAHIAELMEQQDNSPLRLSEEQAEEVRRRLADPNPQTMTLAEFNERLKRRYGV
jgi:transposase